MNRRKCKNDPNRFCYICGKVAMPDQHSKITQFVKSCYHAYFGIQIADQDKSFAPRTCCRTCVESLRHWNKGKMKSLAIWCSHGVERRDGSCDRLLFLHD